LPAAWEMRIGGLRPAGKVLLEEVSLTRTPAFEDARALSVGAEALATFELLTEAACSGAISDTRRQRVPD
jgi:hypothetical protein